jgi:glycosyltransferase involved in cell wall biosynthesis
MGYHIILSRLFDLESINKEAGLDKRPNHVVWNIGKSLNAKIHQPGNDIPSALDKICAKIFGTPELWALLRRLSFELTSKDIVFCIGEDTGFLLSFLCPDPKKRPKLIVGISDIQHKKILLAYHLFRAGKRTDIFVPNTTTKANYLTNNLGISQEKVHILFAEPPIDLSFFRPGLVSTNKQRTIIGSGGLESRDYRTLAAATSDMDLDVKICAASPNATVLKRTFPDVIPANMSSSYYDLVGLRQLYWDSDIVVVTLYENTQEAGFTTMLEAMACGRPVIMTRKPGAIDEMIEAGCLTGVNVGDVEGLKKAIKDLLGNPEKAAIQAQRGYDFVVKHYNSQLYIDDVVDLMKTQ